MKHHDVCYCKIFEILLITVTCTILSDMLEINREMLHITLWHAPHYVTCSILLGECSILLWHAPYYSVACSILLCGMLLITLWHAPYYSVACTAPYSTLWIARYNSLWSRVKLRLSRCTYDFLECILHTLLQLNTREIIAKSRPTYIFIH